jgi:hypothetical protein
MVTVLAMVSAVVLSHFRRRFAKIGHEAAQPT